MLGRNDTKRQFNQQRPSLLPMGGNRMNVPARSALGARQTYQAPQWPDRPQYQEPEQAFDIQRAMTAAIEARLLPQEFNNILGQMGMVNQQERDQAIGEYSRELELYGDEIKRMEFEQTEKAGIAKAGEERFQKDRKYGLDLAKGAREALGKERQYGLDLAGHELEKTKSKRQYGLDVGKHDLEIAKTKFGQKEKSGRYGLDVAKFNRKGKERGFTYKEEVEYNKDLMAKIREDQGETEFKTPLAKRMDTNRRMIEYNSTYLPGYTPPKNMPIKTGKAAVGGETLYMNSYGKWFSDVGCTKRAGTDTEDGKSGPIDDPAGDPVGDPKQTAKLESPGATILKKAAGVAGEGLTKIIKKIKDAPTDEIRTGLAQNIRSKNTESVVGKGYATRSKPTPFFERKSSQPPPRQRLSSQLHGLGKVSGSPRRSISLFSGGKPKVPPGYSKKERELVLEVYADLEAESKKMSSPTTGGETWEESRKKQSRQRTPENIARQKVLEAAARGDISEDQKTKLYLFFEKILNKLVNGPGN